MPAYSFQERFIPFLLDGSKDHTVRAERAGRSRHARPGDKLYLYYGMRTKWCRKIGEATCVHVCRILILQEGIILDDGLHGALTEDQADHFAWSDGFRPEGTSRLEPVGAWNLMLRWWKQTHELPFQGVVIYWKDFKPTETATKIGDKPHKGV